MTIPEAQDRSQDIISRLCSFLEQDLSLANEIIDKEVGDGSAGIALIHKTSRHILGGGGKRLRPLLVLLCARMCRYREGDAHHKLAAAVELMHTATLLHDDVVDTSPLRRGRETAQRIWGNKASVLVGDFLLGASFQLMVSADSPASLKSLSHAARVIAMGEVLQLTATQSVDFSLETYERITHAKTGALFASACEVGGLICNDEASAHLADYGASLGLIFQIVDDMLDYFGASQETGKRIGGDFFEGKITLPCVFLYLASSDGEKKALRDLFSPDVKKRNFKEFNYVLAQLEEHHVLERTQDYIARYVQKAKNACASLRCNHEGEELAFLDELIVFCTKRSS